MEPDDILDPWCSAPDVSVLTPAALRLARRVPKVRAVMDEVLTDPLQRALAGVGDAPAPGADVASRVLVAQAIADGGGALDAAAMAALEADAEGDPEWWVPAARLHVLASEERERLGRMRLSDQDLPYVFPGELHPLQVETLAVGDRVLTALHVDWMRKLTKWVSDALVVDLRVCGLWFWPDLRYMSERRLAPALKKLQRLRRGRPGSKGLMVAYHYRIGQDWRKLVPALAPVDAFHAAIGVASDRPDR